MGKSLILFDFDGTLTKKDTLFQFIYFTKGKFIGFMGLALLSPLIILYALKLLSAERLKIFWFSFYFKGLTQSELEKSGEDFISYLLETKQFNEEIFEKMKNHIEAGAEVCIVSASMNIWIEAFAKRYNINYLCTELKMGNGIFTGNLNTPNCNRAEKATRIKQKYNLKEFDKIIAYGNSSGDKEMFELAAEVIKV